MNLIGRAVPRRHGAARPRTAVRARLAVRDGQRDRAGPAHLDRAGAGRTTPSGRAPRRRCWACCSTWSAAWSPRWSGWPGRTRPCRWVWSPPPPASAPAWCSPLLVVPADPGPPPQSRRRLSRREPPVSSGLTRRGPAGRPVGARPRRRFPQPTRRRFPQISATPVDRGSASASFPAEVRDGAETESRQQVGRRGEDLACAELERQGLAVLARNWRCPWGRSTSSRPTGRTRGSRWSSARSSAAAGSASAIRWRRSPTPSCGPCGSWPRSGCGRTGSAARIIRVDAIGVVLVPGQEPSLTHVKAVG